MAEIDEDVFSLIADWQHNAILELTEEADFDPNPAWIARQLSITWVEAQTALNRLLNAGLLVQKKNKKIKKTHVWITTSDHTLTTAAHRRRQKQILAKSTYSLENDPIEERSHTAITIAIDPSRLAQAKQMILDFQRGLCAYLSQGKPGRVYELSVSLFPLQRKREETVKPKEKSK